MKHKLIILGILIAVIVASYFAIKSDLLELPKDGGIGAFTLALIIAAALVDSVNPCAFSVLLITIAFLFNMGKDRANITKIGSAYIAGIFIAYVLIGLGILKTLYLFDTPHLAARVGAAILFFAGLIELANWMTPNFPIKLKMPQSSHKYIAKMMEKGSVVSAVAMGVLVAMFEFPCTGGPYLFVLGLLRGGSTYFEGFSLLILYNLIFVLPLVAILTVASDKNLLEKVREWKKQKSKNVQLASGIIMILLGIAIILI